jgi:hypothetical protein
VAKIFLSTCFFRDLCDSQTLKNKDWIFRTSFILWNKLTTRWRTRVARLLVLHRIAVRAPRRLRDYAFSSTLNANGMRSIPVHCSSSSSSLDIKMALFSVAFVLTQCSIQSLSLFRSIWDSPPPLLFRLSPTWGFLILQKIPFCSVLIYVMLNICSSTSEVSLKIKAITLYPGRIRSHDP